MANLSDNYLTTNKHFHVILLLSDFHFPRRSETLAETVLATRQHPALLAMLGNFGTWQEVAKTRMVVLLFYWFFSESKAQ